MGKSAQHYWAGEASVRLHATEVVPGFAQLSIETDDHVASAWGGQFFAHAAPAVEGGVPAELLLPGDLVGRVILGPAAQGRVPITGQVPWHDWPRLMEGGFQLVEPRLTREEGYLEARGPSAITPESWVNISDVPFEPGTRFLLDYRPVQRITVPFEWFLGAAEELERLGLKVAVVATSPMAFGISRQTILTAGLDEERRFRVFRDYDEARLWVLSD